MKKKDNTFGDYSKIELGEFSNLTKNTFQPTPNFKIEGKRFIKDELGLTGSEISFNRMEANTAISFLHKHKENEEVCIGVHGVGQLLLNDNYVDVKEGTIVRVSRNTERAIRNNSQKAFTFIVLQAKEDSLSTSDTSDGYGIEKKPNWN